MEGGFCEQGLNVNLLENQGNGLQRHHNGCPKVRLIHVGSAAWEKRLTQFCVYSVVIGSTVDMLQ